MAVVGLAFPLSWRPSRRFHLCNSGFGLYSFLTTSLLSLRDMAGVDNTPALSPPEGVVSNFDNPYSLSGAFIATTVLCIPLATFAVAIRLATIPNRPTQKFRIEDGMCWPV